jgi:hypothetical protein
LGGSLTNGVIIHIYVAHPPAAACEAKKASGAATDTFVRPQGCDVPRRAAETDGAGG